MLILEDEVVKNLWLSVVFRDSEYFYFYENYGNIIIIILDFDK